MDYRDVTLRESLKHVSMGMERWGFLFSVVSSPIVYFLTTTRAVCPNINPIMLCAHVCDVNYAACYLPISCEPAHLRVLPVFGVIKLLLDVIR